MDIQPSVAPTNPYHIARAYGVQPVRKPEPVAPSAPVTGAAHHAGDGPARPAQTGVTRLVAGTVAGGVDFSGEQPVPAGASIPFYRHPAEQNAAATVVTLGRRLDVSG